MTWLYDTVQFLLNGEEVILKNKLLCRKNRLSCIPISFKEISKTIFKRVLTGQWKSTSVIAVRRNNTLLLGPSDSLIDICLLEEPCTESLVYNIIENNNIKNVLNIGAFIGSYAVPLASYGIKVIAIEPNPIALVFLNKNIIINNVEKNISVYRYAICNKLKEKFCITKFHIGSSSLLSSNKKCRKVIEVSCINNLKNLLYDNIDLAIIDVEGLEDYVIKILPSKIDNLIIEVRAGYLGKIFEMMRKRNYDCYIVEKLIGAPDIYNIYCRKYD